MILATTIALHNLNFANKYLKKPGEKPDENVFDLISNQIRAANLIAMVHSAASKYITFQPSSII